MLQIRPHPLPTHALLTKYASAGAYTDCFATEIARTVSHAEFVEAFYTGGLFKVERFLLRVFISKPSTDLQARQLAAGELNELAAWRVEARAVHQLLLCAIDGRTRSWLMVSAAQVPGRTPPSSGRRRIRVRLERSLANPAERIQQTRYQHISQSPKQIGR
jgi:hypothetical protein